MMTDTVGMELLEREASLAVLAGYATEARRGDGRLVVLGGEAGVGLFTVLAKLGAPNRNAAAAQAAKLGLLA
jgi:flagellar biosynthesis GTPase FlhF